MSTVTHMAEIRNDNSLITPAQMLRHLADQIDAGEVEGERAVALILDDSEDEHGKRFRFESRCAKITTVQLLALIECFKADLVSGMGFGS